MQVGPAALACAVAGALGGSFLGLLLGSRPSPPAAACGPASVLPAESIPGGAAVFYLVCGVLLLLVGFLLGAYSVLKWTPLSSAPAPVAAHVEVAPAPGPQASRRLPGKRVALGLKLN